MPVTTTLATVTIPLDVWGQVVALAERESRSRSNMVAVLVAEALARRSEGAPLTTH